MATHQKSLIKALLDRMDDLMALNESRGAAKEAARVEGKTPWAFTTGKMHSYKTRQVYQEHVLNFARWVRETYGLKRLDEVDARAHELTSAFLQARLDEGKSAYTLQTIRAALRLVFSDRTLMQDVPLPERTRATITRSRGPKSHDTHVNPDHWPTLIHFLQATGLRRDEVKMLRAGDIIACDLDPSSRYTGQMVVQVRNGKGGKARTVPVLRGHEQHVWMARAALSDPDIVFPRIPSHLDVHSYRREYAQALYLYHAPNRPLPPTLGRLKANDYDRDAAYQVTLALGHNRIDVVLRHYLR